MLMPWALDVASFLTTLVVAFAANDGSLSVQHRAASPDFLPRSADHGKWEELAWPPQLSEAEARGLRQDAHICFNWLIELEEAAAFAKMRACMTQKENARDMRIAGSYFAIRQECWCETDMAMALSWYGCESHPGYALYYQVNCTPSCSLPEAQQCILDCPASCLETDYAPEFCSTAFDNCVEHLLCITEHSTNMTSAGSVDHPFHCDDAQFDASPEWLAWKECYRELPKRTHWHRHNAQNHCFCQENLKAAVEQHTCCNSSWGKSICDEQCATADANIDCTSAEATQCAADCNNVCLSLFTDTVSAECKQQCFDSSSTCAKYSVCPPAGDVQFDYVCDDGNPPSANGCCGSSQICPSQCSNEKGFIFIHGRECLCLGCPSSVEAAKAKFSLKLENDMDANGIQALASISKQIGILGANRKMQLLMKQRNAALQEAFKDHTGSVDAAWDQKAAQIIDQYQVLIVAEANAFKARGEVDDVPPADGADGAKQDNTLQKGDGDSNLGVIIGAICAAVGLCLCTASILVYRRGKARNASSEGAGTGNFGPNEGDSNVVMGRPVEQSDTSNAAQGAPVSKASEKGSDEPEKPT